MRKIRNGLFETNSSSTHAIGLTNNEIKECNIPETIKFINGLQFGWEYEIYDEPNEKFTYLIIAMSSLKYKDFKNGTDMITKALKSVGVKSIIYPEITVENEEDPIVVIKESDNYDTENYIDHQKDFIYDYYNTYNKIDEDKKFLNILKDKSSINKFILGNSWITTGNDNNDGYWLPSRGKLKQSVYGFYDEDSSDEDDIKFKEAYDELSENFKIYFK